MNKSKRENQEETIKTTAQIKDKDIKFNRKIKIDHILDSIDLGLIDTPDRGKVRISQQNNLISSKSSKKEHIEHINSLLNKIQNIVEVINNLKLGKYLNRI